MANKQPIIRDNRLETIVIETQDEDLNKPATIGMLRILAVHADVGFAQLHIDLERLNEKVDSVWDGLGQRIDNVEQKLGQRIDHVEQKLGQRIDSSVIELKAVMSANMSTILDQISLRSGSDRFLKAAFSVAVIGVLIQTVFVALK